MVLAKQDLPLLEPLDEASWGGVSAPVLIWKQTLLPAAGTRVLGHFRDGRAAVVERRRGAGRAVVFGFFPGMAYLRSGLPLRPVDRGGSQDSFSHFLPTAMSPGLREALVDAFLPPQLVRPVVCDAPLVEATLIDSPPQLLDGSTADRAEPPRAPRPTRLAVPLMNYSGVPVARLTVRVAGIDSVRSVRSVERGPLRGEVRAGTLVVSLPFDVADMLLIDR
jgi:hypothetical protein